MTPSTTFNLGGAPDAAAVGTAAQNTTNSYQSRAPRIPSPDEPEHDHDHDHHHDHHAIDSPGSVRTAPSRRRGASPHPINRNNNDADVNKNEHSFLTSPSQTLAPSPHAVSASLMRHHERRPSSASRDQLIRRRSFSFHGAPNSATRSRSRSRSSPTGSSSHRISRRPSHQHLPHGQDHGHGHGQAQGQHRSQGFVHREQRASRPPVHPSSTPSIRAHLRSAPTHQNHRRLQNSQDWAVTPEDDAGAEVELVEAAPDAAPELEDVPDEEILEDDEEDGFQGDHESEDSNENEPTEFSEFPFKNVESAITSLNSSSAFISVINTSVGEMKIHEKCLRQQLAKERDANATASINLSQAKQNVKDLEQSKSTLEQSVKLKAEQIETMKGKLSLLEDTLSTLKEKHDKENTENDEKAKQLLLKLEDITHQDNEKSKSLASMQSHLESLESALSTAKDEQKYSQERFEQREKEWDESFKYQKKEKELAQTKLAEMEVNMRKVQMDSDKLSDNLKTLTVQFQGCKETVDQLQKVNFELEYKNRELKTGQEAVEMKLKEAFDREKVNLDAVKSMFQTLSSTYLALIDNEKDDEEELGDLLKDGMVHSLLKSVEPSSFEAEARSLQQSLEEGLTLLDERTLVTKGTLWIASLLNNRLPHKHELKQFIINLNGALTAYAELICGMLHVDYHKRIETGAIRMQPNEGVSTRLMMVSRVMDVVAETCQMAEYNHSRRQLRNNNMDLDSNTDSQNAAESYGLSDTVADDRHDNQQIRPRPRPRHNQAHVKHEAQFKTEEAHVVNTDDDTDFQSKQDADPKAETDDDVDTDNKSGEAGPKQGKYNLRAKYESKNHGKRRAKVVEAPADESEGMNEAESGQPEESPAGSSTAQRRKKTKRSIITGQVGNMR